MKITAQMVDDFIDGNWDDNKPARGNGKGRRYNNKRRPNKNDEDNADREDNDDKKSL